MNLHDVAVIDYGMGNLLSVQRGLEHCGATVAITSDPVEILSAPRVLLPGVGAFGVAMAELCRLNLDEVVREVAARGNHLLGICLGMQMLLDGSEEFGATPGLGLIPGQVIPIPTTTKDGQLLKVPHIRWNALILPEGRNDWQGTAMQNTKEGEAAYFVHSFMSDADDTDHRIADCLYGGVLIPALIGKDNVHGCQFHPEKSGMVGLNVLRQFLLL